VVVVRLSASVLGHRGNVLREYLAMCLKSGHAKFQRSSARGTFLNLGLNEEGVGNSMQNWPYVGNGHR